MKKNTLFNTSYRVIDTANDLMSKSNSSFAAIYKQYKILQSLWFRVVEDASDSKSRRLETLSVDLENAIQKCKAWIAENSPKES